MGVAALVLGILAVIFAIIPSFLAMQTLGLFVGIIALVLGAIERKKAQKQNESTRMATAGIVLGIIAVVLSALIFITCQCCMKKIGDEIGKGTPTKLLSN